MVSAMPPPQVGPPATQSSPGHSILPLSAPVPPAPAASHLRPTPAWWPLSFPGWDASFPLKTHSITSFQSSLTAHLIRGPFPAHLPQSSLFPSRSLSFFLTCKICHALWHGTYYLVWAWSPWEPKLCFISCCALQVVGTQKMYVLVEKKE